MVRPDCPQDTDQVNISIDSTLTARVTQADSQGYYTVTLPNALALGLGAHTVQLVTTSKWDPSAVIEKTTQFTLASASATLDKNSNRLPDDPFNTLTECGSTWFGSGLSTDTGQPYSLGMIRFAGACGSEKANVNGPTAVTLQNPANPAQSVTVTVPEGLLYQGQEGILLVQMAPDLTSLYGATEASIFGMEPGALVAGGQYVEVSLLVTLTGSNIFTKISPDRLAAKPLHFTMTGLTFTANGNPTLYAHPSFPQENPSTGLEIVVWQGDWTTTHVRNLVATDSTMEGDLVELSTFAPFEKTVGAPKISVSPTPEDGYRYGFIEIGTYKETTSTVTNIAETGGSRLQGEVKVAAPFTITSGANYDLAPGEQAQVVVRFTPDGKKAYSGNVIFTGGGGAVVQVTGTGYVKEGETPSCFGGTTTTSSTGGGAMTNAKGDLFLLALMISVLLLAQKTFAKAWRRVA